jgi:uncharacterized protein (DUF58 family)
VKKGAGAFGLAILGALFVPSWPIQLVCYISICLTMLSLLYAVLTRRAIRVERDAVDLRANPHSTVQVGITIRNGSYLPFSYAAVRDHQGGLRSSEATETVVSLPSRGSARLVYSLKTLGRGVHELGPVVVSSADPLGLFPWQASLESRGWVTVLPDVGLIRHEPRVGLAGGDLLVRNVALEDASRFRAVREYVTGDDTRRIHWKTSARLGVLHTVEYEPAVSAPCLVALDLRLDRYPLRLRYHYVERAIETAATLVVVAIGGRQQTGLVAAGSPGGMLAALAKGMVDATRILEFLARIVPVESGAGPVDMLLGSGSRIPPGTRVCLVGPAAGEDQIEQVRVALGPARLEVYQVGSRDSGSRVTSRGVRVFGVRTYGEELAGD